MKLDLHVHTNHSFDGRIDVETLLKTAKEAGLDAVAITDHDTMSAVGLAKKITGGVAVIPGMEITAAGGMHIIGLFLTDEIISREIDNVIDEIHQQGGLVMIPHPYRPGTGLMDIKEERGGLSGERKTCGNGIPEPSRDLNVQLRKGSEQNPGEDAYCCRPEKPTTPHLVSR